MADPLEIWTPEQDALLMKLRAKKTPYRRIARVLQRTNDACRTRYKKLNRRLSPVEEAEMAFLSAIDNYVPAPTANVIWPPDGFPVQDESDLQDEFDTWTDYDLETLYELRTSGVPYSLISQDLRRTIKACRDKWLSTDWTAQSFYNADKLADADEYSVKKTDFREKIFSAADRRHERHKMGLDILADRLEKAVRRLPNIPPPVWNPDRLNTKDVKEEDVMLILSDIHIGAEHTFEETGGISAFNRKILYRRIDNLQYAVRDIVELHSQLYDLPHLHVACIGDVVAGDNSSGEWSQNYINMPIVDQVIEGVNKLKNMIAYWLTIFPEITFYGVRGNHGRTGKKGVEKDYSNYDYLCYKFLEMAFENNPRVKFVIPKTWWIMTEIRGHKFLLVHGDDVRGGSLPVKGLAEFEKAMNGIVREIADYTIAGHFHTSAEISTNQGCVMVNGSFVGGDIYSIKTIHANCKAEQTIFGINESRGKTWKYNIDLDDERVPG